jgi:hypothetical protein
VHGPAAAALWSKTAGLRLFAQLHIYLAGNRVFLLTLGIQECQLLITFAGPWPFQLFEAQLARGRRAAIQVANP